MPLLDDDPNDYDDPQARKGLKLVAEIEDLLDRVGDSAYDKAESFFDGVKERSQSIAETIRQFRKGTDRQIAALVNMRDGVQKWVHDD